MTITILNRKHFTFTNILHSTPSLLQFWVLSFIFYSESALVIRLLWLFCSHMALLKYRFRVVIFLVLPDLSFSVLEQKISEWWYSITPLDWNCTVCHTYNWIHPRFWPLKINCKSLWWQASIMFIILAIPYTNFPIRIHILFRTSCSAELFCLYSSCYENRWWCWIIFEFQRIWHTFEY